MLSKNFKFFFIFLIVLIIPSIAFAYDENSNENLAPNEFQEIIETSGDITDIPDINARHAVVIDRLSGRVLYGKKENEKCKMASTTKIMTCLVVLENATLSDTVVVSSKSAHTGGSRLGLSTDDKITVEHLLYGLMLCSR